MSLKRCLFKKHELVTLRTKAFRRRVWYKTLKRIERGLVDSVIKVVDEIRSVLLAKVLTKIAEKLRAALESTFKRVFMRVRAEVGQPLAQKLSLLAQSWGNNQAYEWADDNQFIQYLTVTSINNPPMVHV